MISHNRMTRSRDLLILELQFATCRVYIRPQGFLETNKSRELFLRRIQLDFMLEESFVQTCKLLFSAGQTIIQNLYGWSFRKKQSWRRRLSHSGNVGRGLRRSSYRRVSWRKSLENRRDKFYDSRTGRQKWLRNQIEFRFEMSRLWIMADCWVVAGVPSKSIGAVGSTTSRLAEDDPGKKVTTILTQKQHNQTPMKCEKETVSTAAVTPAAANWTGIRKQAFRSPPIMLWNFEETWRWAASHVNREQKSETVDEAETSQNL